MMISEKKLILILLAILFCSTPILSCSHKQDTIKTELYFGLSIANGAVTEEDWNSFKTEILDKTLPGYTLVNGNGYWKGENSQTYTEKTIILVYLHNDSPEEAKKIASVIEKYKKQFRQESVLQTDQAIEYSFR